MTLASIIMPKLLVAHFPVLDISFGDLEQKKASHGENQWEIVVTQYCHKEG